MFPPKMKELEEEVAFENVRKFEHPTLPLVGYVYSQNCEMKNVWNKINKWARGIIFDKEIEEIVALPFPKFFNLNQNHESGYSALPKLPFEATIKHDGSLIIIFNYRGTWLTSTKGSFTSEQAQWASEVIRRPVLSLWLSTVPEYYTIICEGIYPIDRKVVDYKGEETLFLITAYNRKDKYEELSAEFLSTYPLKTIDKIPCDDIQDLVKFCDNMSGLEQEGYVVRFWDGFRVKIKCADYLRIHRLVSYATPLNAWESLDELRDLNNVPKIREEYWNGIPDEFMQRLKLYEGILREKYKNILDKSKIALIESNEKTDGSRKEVAKYLRANYKELMDYCFKIADNNIKNLDKVIKNAIRPTGNDLEN